jgi:hypothetical protein
MSSLPHIISRIESIEKKVEQIPLSIVESNPFFRGINTMMTDIMQALDTLKRDAAVNKEILQRVEASMCDYHKNNDDRMNAVEEFMIASKSKMGLMGAFLVALAIPVGLVFLQVYLNI